MHIPLAKSSSTSMSCSAAMLYKAVTLYLLVFLLVSRRDDIVAGEDGASENEDIADDVRGEEKCCPRVERDRLVGYRYF